MFEPRQCSLFWDYIPESKLCFCVNLCRPSGPYSIRPIQKLLSCQTTMGSNQNNAVALSSRNNMISIHQRKRGRMKAKQRWFKVTRELCHEWFHHVRHHIHDGHWTGEFDTVIWRLHCFTVSFLGNVRGESGSRELASFNWRTPQWARGQFTRNIIPDKMAWYKILIHVLIV